MTVYEVQSPKGKTYEIEADSLPSGAQLQALLMRMEGPSKPEPAPEQPSALSRFAGGAWDMLNPATIAKGVGQAILHPIDTATAMADAQSERAVKAYDLAKEGRYSEAAGNAGAAVLPILGPVAAGIGEQAGSGDIAGAAGKLTGLLALPSLAKGGTRVLKAAAPVAGDVATGLGRAAADPGTYIAVGSGAGTGYTVGGHVGAGLGAITAGALKATPEVWKAVKAGLKERGMSGAQAEAAIAKMPPQELAATVEAVTQTPAQVSARAAMKAQNMEAIAAKQKAYWEAHPKPAAAGPAPAPVLLPEKPLPVGVGNFPELTPEQMAQVEANFAPGGMYAAAKNPIQPIPPSKLPPVLPDPVVPELAPAKPAPKPRQTKPKPAQEAPKAEPAPEVKAEPAKTPDGVHPGYQALVDKVKGKSFEEATKILADEDVSSFLAPGILEKAGIRKAPVGDVVTSPHPGQASPAYVNTRLRFLQEQAAKRGDAPAIVKGQIEANKSLGGDLADLLAQDAPTYPKGVREDVLSLKSQGKSRAQIKSEILKNTMQTLKPAEVQRMVDEILKESK